MLGFMGFCGGVGSNLASLALTVLHGILLPAVESDRSWSDTAVPYTTPRVSGFILTFNTDLQVFLCNRILCNSLQKLIKFVI